MTETKLKLSKHDLERVAGLHSKISRAENDLEAIAAFKVVGVAIKNASPEVHRIEKGGNNSTGTISSLGFEDDLQAELTEAFQSVFRRRVTEAREALVGFGIELT